MRTLESEEMYLETLLILKSKTGIVRSVDIVSELGYAKSSVSRAVNLLQKKGYSTMDKNGFLEFTEEGRKKADDVYARHRVITALLISIGADDETAEDNACRIEHVITKELFEVMKKHLLSGGSEHKKDR